MPLSLLSPTLVEKPTVWPGGPRHPTFSKPCIQPGEAAWQPRFCRRRGCWGLGRDGSGHRSPRARGCPAQAGLVSCGLWVQGLCGGLPRSCCRQGRPPSAPSTSQASALRSQVCLVRPHERPPGPASVPKDTDSGHSPSLGPSVAGEAGRPGAGLPPVRVREQVGPLSPLRLHPSGEEAARTSSVGDRGAVPWPADRLTPAQASPDSQVPSPGLEIKVTFWA